MTQAEFFKEVFGSEHRHSNIFMIARLEKMGLITADEITQIDKAELIDLAKERYLKAKNDANPN